MTDVAVSKTLETLARYQKLAEHPENRKGLLDDPTHLTALLYFIDDINPGVATAALQVVSLLLERPKDAAFLRKDQRFLTAINSANKKVTKTDQVNLLLTLCLKSLAPREEPLKDKKNETSLNNSSNNTSNTSSGAGFKAPHIPSKKRPVRFIGGGLRAQSLTFKLEGNMFAENVSLVEERLLQVKGVISIYMDKATQKCIVRTRLETKPEVVGESMCVDGLFKVWHVTKDELGEEVFTCLGDIGSAGDKENQHNLPAYLDETFGDSPHKICDKAMVDPANMSTKKRRESNSWVSSVTSFLSSSFYW